MTSAGSRPQAANSKGPVVLSAGGTGGHMFPAFALARALLVRGVKVQLVTDLRGARYRDQYPDIPFQMVRAETLRSGFVAKIRFVIDLLVGIGQAMRFLRALRPRAVVGFGGYPSFPAVIAAHFLKIPVLLHEQNAVLGRANRVLAGQAKAIALSLPNVESLPEKWRAKTIVTGNPVRAEIAESRPYAAPGAGPEDRLRVLILGGSQGASVFSRLMPEAVALLPEALRRRLDVVQQCRAADIGMCRHAYDVAGVKVRLERFVTDVPQQLAACHLLVSRSGASTVSEAAVAGRPALFIPYPHHADQQQRANAMVLVRAGAAKMLDQKGLTAQILAKELESLLENPAELAAMAGAARAALGADAAKRLADAILAL
ncbi:MAG: undecaprenyldiphospho-muramoylpentapeptide beta-N-acetylglucosaminyltransferase [Alphaproteobacteria bacterium]|nr:undecaprenyldiphospho-muramoylpentapeptide beta-N-acetylglucosaminyltransferase [Alphaproteobacteria bacterium]